MGTRTNDCRKFTPNIFNKSKCSHCFRQREEHSAAALECNRATRKVSKCGYLFVAPDWDFSNPLYRTKRWQRRWFVLYDDGELTYSVDEHPETIPQAIIDMTKVLEVTTAEDVTGHTNSIAITASDRVTFVKGTCPEEAKWWLNVLQAFPKSKGRHKRNATFPGGKTTTIIQTTCPTNTRARHNSYHKDTLATSTFNNLVDIIPTTWNTVSQTPKVITTSRDQDENNKNAGNELTDEENNAEDKSTLSDSKNLWPCSINALTISNPDKLSSDKIESSLGTNTEKSDNVNSLKDEVDYVPAPRPDLEVQNYYKEVSSRPKSLPLASKTAPAIVSAIVKKVPPVINTTGQNTNSGNISSLRVKPSLSLEKTQTQERGDPDGGCTLDELSASYLSKTAEFRIGMPVDENLSSKKGWLMKQDTRTGEWTKHWFALRGAALFYYRDQLAEERGVLDGVLDANSLISVTELTSQKKYSFQLTTWDNRRIVLSAVSANSRNNWINVLHSVAGIQRKIEPKTSTSDSCSKLIIKDNASDDLKREIEKDLIKTQRTKELISRSHKVCEAIQESIPLTSAPVSTPTTFTTPKNLLVSSDEEYRTASEGGRRDSVDWGSPLSPSPPIPRALFRSKERIRTRSTSANSRFQNRSRSSPPSSRRSTVDSVGSDDIPLIHPVEEECTNEKQLQIRLDFVEKERDSLRDEARERESRMAELLSTLDRTELELNSRIQETEQARDSLSMQLLEANNKAEKIIGRMTLELEQNEKRIKDLEEQLVRGIDENDTLYKKIDEMENSNSSGLTANLNRQKMKRVDSLSDLTNLNDVNPYCLNHEMLADEYNELRSRFEKAVNEIRAMKKELRESQKEFDSLELSYTALKQDLEQRENEDKSQLQMMAERIQDLTFKYSGSERQVRILRQKLAKFERRKSLSLKGKEVTEDKVDSVDKSASMEQTAQESYPADEKLTRRLQSHTRRKSLDGNMNTSTDSLNLLVRQSASEKRIAASIDSIPDTLVSKNNSSSSPHVSEHIVERLRYLEKVLIATKDKLEQNQMYLHSLRSSRSRRSVSPMTDRKDSLRFIERCLNEVIKLLRDSCESCVNDDFDNNTLMSPSNPVKLALAQVDSQLKLKLNELLTQRRVLRERNELSSKKNLELVAERIAYESVCFGILRDSIRRAEDPTCTRENWTKAEMAETSQLMAALKSKLGGKCSLKPKGSLDILARILARRLVLSQSKKDTEKQRDTQPISSRAMDVLLRQQNELNLITKRYKNNVMESLAADLAAETLSYISSNDVVQGTVQEVWRQAQEAVNTELVQSEIAHIMIRNAQRFENSMTPSFGYCLTTEEIVSFENFSDAVHDVLRKEIDNAIEQLTHCYEENLNKMKRGQWRLHLEQERKACEGRQLLSEFADVIAHKAFVDARISVLKGDYKSNEYFEEDAQNINFSALQKYENLFEELTSDLQIDNAGDILAEADFNFMYRNYTFELLNNKSELNEVFAALRELGKAIDLLPSTTNREKNEKSENSKIKSFKDFIDECFQVRTRIGAVVECLRESKNSCEHCQKMQNSICNLTSQHETEMYKLQKEHESDVNALRLQIEEHLNSIKVLECERMSILKDLNLHSNLIEDRERELETISQKLKDKEKEYDRKSSETLELFEQLGAEQHKCKILLDENSKLRNKCLHQNDEYAALLQERDFVQTELNKERERARRLEKRLEMLETEHTKQLECLQQAYKEQIMTHCTDLSGVSEGESFHQRYQSEIEQLRTLCEKGLAAMESSHRRIIKDLEDKHRQEIERLLIEKDQALAEETQATLAALDAMRKAHQSEVQREIARFKQDFLRQVQKSGTTGVHANEKEEELEELRQEILSFSEKYSVKCVENAALEEKLHIANQKLRHFQQMQQLELRNKQFRAHLASEDISDLKFVQGLRTKEEVNSPDSEV